MKHLDIIEGESLELWLLGYGTPDKMTDHQVTSKGDRSLR